MRLSQQLIESIDCIQQAGDRVLRVLKLCLLPGDGGRDLPRRELLVALGLDIADEVSEIVEGGSVIAGHGRDLLDQRVVRRLERIVLGFESSVLQRERAICLTKASQLRVEVLLSFLLPLSVFCCLLPCCLCLILRRMGRLLRRALHLLRLCESHLVVPQLLVLHPLELGNVLLNLSPLRFVLVEARLELATLDLQQVLLGPKAVMLGVESGEVLSLPAGLALGCRDDLLVRGLSAIQLGLSCADLGVRPAEGSLRQL